jgi:hypothetical protein
VIKIRSLAIILIAFALLSSACIKHVTVAELLPVNAPVSVDELVKKINSFSDINTLGVQGTIYVRNYFTGKDGKADEFPGANYLIRLMRPESIRMQVKAPVISTRVADMVSDGKMFRLAVYYPDDKKQFIYGSNLNEVRRMERGELKDPTLVKAGGLLNMRPQHFTDAFLVKPINGNLEIFREEVFQEEDDTRPGKKGKRVSKSYYVLYVVERKTTADSQNVVEIRRKFWFDRTAQNTPLARQQTFEGDGRLASDIFYSKWFVVEKTDKTWPENIIVDRRNDGYRIELTLEKESVDINLELTDTTFKLENDDKLKEMNLDEPRKPETKPEPKKKNGNG